MVKVLVWSADASLSQLWTWNLQQRGFEVVQELGGPCCGPWSSTWIPADVVIADLDCPEPRCWEGVGQARKRFPRTPLVLLSYAWPSGTRLQQIQPYAYLRKPFAISELLQTLQQVLSV